MNNKHIIIIVALILLSSILSGLTVYYYQNEKLEETEKDLNEDIKDLENKLKNLESEYITDDGEEQFVPSSDNSSVSDRENNSSTLAEKTLTNFFDLLVNNNYTEAVKIFAPPTNTGGYDWEGLDAFTELSNRNNKAKVLEDYCNAVGTCLKVKIIETKENSKDHYTFTVNFIESDGSVYVFGPCCGMTEEEMPSTDEFKYDVKKIDGSFKVTTVPLYRP